MPEKYLSPEENRLRDLLIRIVPREHTLTYHECCKYAYLLLDLENPFDRRSLARILFNIDGYEVVHDRPMLTVIVFHPISNRPGKVFFETAKRLGLLEKNASPSQKNRFFRKQLDSVFNRWGDPLAYLNR